MSPTMKLCLDEMRMPLIQRCKIVFAYINVHRLVSRNQIVYKMEKFMDLIDGQCISFENRILHPLELFKIAVTGVPEYTLSKTH